MTSPAIEGAGSGTVVPGRVVVAGRALTHLFTALAATELGVPARRVSTSVGDSRGRLRVRIEAPIAHDRAAAESVLDAVRSARERVQAEGIRLSGATLVDVELRATGATLIEGRRVA